ncbi:hypothetical protein [Methylobacterium oxalidis]|uniref:Uncharacterized protein n=1 Tax=Methylobacterium oxalidis TaxID=944322 RepID=A0A512J913_9HYPH|nr:hypothetical protein [Methylobacterium oxalidis]GEP06442.1 hypothetical protein MOX02_44800 [Methylobacterium oxalidis]GJE33532.1 hypothetical protein LDDCCGHA_3732 [Methylobacterium oxalidis]GLS65482.1 hypothetical protein GCM10007888_38640 [Methylobacterium oxalidis]
MNDAIDDLVAERLSAAAGDPAALADLRGALIAGLSLAIAVTAEGSDRAASFLCEEATSLLFETVTEHAWAVGHLVNGR